MDTATFYQVTNTSSLPKHIIEEHLTDYENTILSVEEAFQTYGLLAKQDSAKLTIKHPVTGKSYIVRYPREINSLNDFDTLLIRFSWRRLKDGRTFVLITRWPL